MKICFNRNLLILLLLLVFFCSSFLFAFTTTKNKDQQKSITHLTKLGQYLFYDHRLSYNLQKSCASCHDPKFCFTDGYRTSAGTDGFNVKHNAPSLINTSLLHYYTWGDSTIQDLSKQILRPLFNAHPVELGWSGHETTILQRLVTDSFYQQAFAKAFPNQTSPIHLTHIIQAISAFEASLNSFQSRFDQYNSGNAKALTYEEMAGMRLFFSSKLNCAKCHENPSRSILQELIYANIGLYHLDLEGSYPKGDQGLYEISHHVQDKGKFRIPSLKNVLLTAPYTHDGSVANIQEMLAIYAAGGRNVQEGDYVGNGSLNPNKSKYINGFTLTKSEQQQLIAFLNTFTDTANLHNPNWIDPFKH